MFGSSDEEVDEEKEALTKKRLEEYAAKKVGFLIYPHFLALLGGVFFSRGGLIE